MEARIQQGTFSGMRNGERRWSMGAEVVAGGAHFRVFAPERKQVAIVLEGDGSPRTLELLREASGFHSALGDGVAPGARYRVRLDHDEMLYPDPASRFQPEGPHGPSEVVDPRAFRWTDGEWPGVTMHGQVLYELHIG
ncbi:MAG TPA: hypothetical protein VLT33_06320, partial [Labilithrix sp.]|nr:hypothetical protein [Labilithrix sp.]